jgi:hypothetical protein
MAQASSADLPDELSELFSRQGLDSNLLICPSGWFVAARRGNCIALGAKQFAGRSNR